MTIAVGIDIVSVDEVWESIQASGDRYLRRVFTEAEIADCTGRSAVDPTRLAARFAAKEATFKALRVGDRAISWHDVEIRRGHAGQSELTLRGQTAELARTAGVTDLALSLSHQRHSAAAVVIAETCEPADK